MKQEYTKITNGFDTMDIWAKTETANQPKQSLIYHSINTGMVAKVLLKESSLKVVLEYMKKNTGESEERIINFVSYIAAMHDIGKCHPIFQQKDKNTYTKLIDTGMSQTDNDPGIFRHELYSVEVIERYLKEKGYSGRHLAYILKTIAMHHEGRTGCNKEIDNQGPWEEMHYKIDHIMGKIFPIQYIDISKSKHVDGFYMVLYGIIVLSDWVASDYYFNASNYMEGTLGEYLKWSYKTAKRAIERSGLGGNTELPMDLTYSDMWQFIENDGELRPIQKECKHIFEKEDPKLMIIEAPMGEGKTEAALYSAFKMSKGRGIYVALPTSATSNQMHIRVNEIFENIGIENSKLLHSMSWLIEYQNESGREDIDDWLNSTRRGMLSANAVGTIDQAMLSVMTVKYGILRLIGLIGKVLIIDEIHAYDSYMSGIIERLLEWCSIFEIPVIMLSATLPEGTKKTYIGSYTGKEINEIKEIGNNYPLITYITDEIKTTNDINSYINSEVRVDPVHIKTLRSKEIGRMVAPVNDQGGCIAIILNTVAEVQNVYGVLKGHIEDDVELMIFHARMPAEQRSQIEHECIRKFGKGGERPKKSIIVATQVLEQSLDVDFDWVITAIAPIDLILQRLGRGHRHSDVIRPKWLQENRVTILIPEEYGTTGLIYAPIVLDRTKEILEKYNKINIPGDVREIIDKVYTIELEDLIGKQQKALWEYQYDNEYKTTKGKSVSLNYPNESKFGLYSGSHISMDEESNEGSKLVAKTRYGEPSQRVAFVDYTELVRLGFYENEEDLKLCEDINIIMKDRGIVEKIMAQTLSLPLHNIETHPGKGYRYTIEGQGLLKGVVIYPVQWGRYNVESEKLFGYDIDDETGVIIRRKWGS